MTDDPFDSQEFRDFADRTLTQLLPMVQDSAVTISLVPDGPPDVKFAIELGFCIMLNKPIIAVVTPGTQVPAKLIAVADAIVEGDIGDPTFQARFNETITRVLGRLPK